MAESLLADVLEATPHANRLAIYIAVAACDFATHLEVRDSLLYYIDEIEASVFFRGGRYEDS